MMIWKLKLNVENENKIINVENLNWNLWWFKNGILIVDGIENVDVKKNENENVIDGVDGVFENKKNIKKIY